MVSSTSVSGTRGGFVGVQGVSTRDFPVTRTGETGSWLGQQFHGRGIGTLMRQAICVLCLDHLGFEEVTSAAFADNPASQGVSRKVGYRPTARSGGPARASWRPWCGWCCAPEDLVRPPHDVEVEGADAFVEFVQARAT